MLLSHIHGLDARRARKFRSNPQGWRERVSRGEWRFAERKENIF